MLSILVAAIGLAKPLCWYGFGAVLNNGEKVLADDRLYLSDGFKIMTVAAKLFHPPSFWRIVYICNKNEICILIFVFLTLTSVYQHEGCYESVTITSHFITILNNTHRFQAS